MMSNFEDFVKSTRDLLKNCITLCDSMESSFLSNDLTDEFKEDKLNELRKKCKKLKSIIVDARKIEVKSKIHSVKRKQNGDRLKENLNSEPLKCGVIIKERKKKILNGDSELDVDQLNNAAKEAILNSSDSESDTCLVAPIKKIRIKLQDAIVSDITNEDIDENISPNESFNDTDKNLSIDENICEKIITENIVSFDNENPSEVKVKNVIEVNSESTIDKKPSTDDMVLDNKCLDNNLIEVKETIKMTSNEDIESIKDCYIYLEDLAKLDSNDQRYKAYIDSLEKEVNNLCQIPKFSNKKSKNSDLTKNKASERNSSTTKSSKIFQSESEDNDSESDNNKKESDDDIDITHTTMIGEPLSSTESDKSSNNSSNSSHKIFRPHREGKSTRNGNDLDRRVTRQMKIPLESDSEISHRTSLSNGKSKKQIKKGDKITKTTTVNISSSSEDESDASASDLRKSAGNKRKKSDGSRKRTKKQKLDDDKEKDIETRKNIHKIISESKLSEATKAAEKLEIQRRKRMEEKQEMYNKSLLTKDLDGVDGKKELILEKNKEGESIVAVHQHIADQLKVHQVEAVNFIYDCVIESVDCLLKSQEEKPDSANTSSSVGGCILAHCMGLGKTLSLIAFMHTMLTTPILNLYSCIVVCPANTAINWKKEWEMWIPADRPIKIFEVCSGENRKCKLTIVETWSKKGGILIIGYEMFRLLASGDTRTIRNKAARLRMQQSLLDPGADFIVCDEGHLLKNEKSAINKMVNKVKTKRRIVLTGTPLQNRLSEYHTMVHFVKPNLLGTHKEFLNRFVNPISNGQHINSTPYDVKIMKKRSHILYKTLDGCVHRRDYSALVKYLPPKYEYIIKIRLTDIQMKLYRAYLAIPRPSKSTLFTDQKSLARIMTHPFVVCMHQEIMDKKAFLADSEEDDFLDDESEDGSSDGYKSKRPKKPLKESNVIDLLSDVEAKNSDDEKKNVTKNADDTEKKEKDTNESDASVEEVVKNWSTNRRSSRINKLNDSGDEANINFELEDLKDSEPVNKHWFSEIIQPEHENQIEISSKLTILFQILRKASDIGDKVIVFSQSLLVLDILERYLQELHLLAEKVKLDLDKLNDTVKVPGTEDGPDGGEDNKSSEFFSDIGYNSWEKGLDYDRMDGSTHVVTRADIMDRFNEESDHRLRLFLISTRAGGMGVNLVAANRVVIFDVSWNPSHDIQAIFRSYRFGQNKPVYVYRLVSQGTIEEKMYERQVTKQSVSLRVVDEQQISRYFTEEDLKSLYKFEPDIYDPDKERETPILPKDRFLAELIKEFPQYIYSYHEHDSLLQNKDEEELTEAERQEAWKEFEDEKVHGPRYPIAPMPASVDPNQFAQAQMALMMQQHPQYAAIYGQNYMNLLRYVLSQQPELKFNPTGLSVRMQTIFFLSLQKYKDANPTYFSSNNSTVASATTTMVANTGDNSATETTKVHNNANTVPETVTVIDSASDDEEGQKEGEGGDDNFKK